MGRVKKSIYNVLFGFLSQAVTIAMGVMIPRLILVNLGSESNGLISSINDILAYLALLELGVGGATAQALYQPAGAGDKKQISGILSATNRYYKKTGIVYLLILVIVAFLYPVAVKSEINYWTIWIVIILSGLPNVITYLFHAKYRLLLMVEGKTYISVNLTTCISIGTSLSKILLLTMGFGVIALQTMYLVFGLIQVAFFSIYVKKRYSWLNLKEEPDYSSISQSKNVMVHQLSGMVFSHTDVMVLSFFCGLKTVSVYTMYSMLFGMIKTLLNTINSSVNFVLGQEFNNNREKFLKLHDAFEICNMALTYSLFCVANIFILPFLKLYTASVTDISYIDKYLPYLFVAISLMTNARLSSMQVLNFAGHFKKTQWRAITEAIINLSVSIVCVNFFGIYGVLMGTIAALFYRSNDMIIYANKKILGRNPWITYRRWIVNLIVYVGIIIISNLIHIAMDNYFILILWAGVYTVVICSIFALANFIAEPKTCKDIAKMVFGIVKRKIVR